MEKDCGAVTEIEIVSTILLTVLYSVCYYMNVEEQYGKKCKGGDYCTRSDHHS